MVESFALLTSHAASVFDLQDIEGTWSAYGINHELMFGRYGPGGHFAPHTDGYTVRDFNHRSLYSVIIYLNR